MSSMCDHGKLNYCEKCPPDVQRTRRRNARSVAFGFGDPVYTPPSTEHLGETARQFEWLKDETAAMAAVSRGFGNIMDNARALDPEAPAPRRRKPEPQRMVFTNKGKKRKHKRR